MDNVYLMFNGKRVELSDDLKQTITETLKEEQANIFKRIENGVTPYYYISGTSEVIGRYDGEFDRDVSLYKVANYCTNKKIMQQRALHEVLSRMLWRYSEQNGGDPEWDACVNHYYLYWNCNSLCWDVYNSITSKISETVYFSSEEAAWAAIENVIKPFMREHPEYIP